MDAAKDPKVQDQSDGGKHDACIGNFGQTIPT
jgi:hypothetical protein